VLDCLWPRQEEVRQSLVQSTAMISNAVLKDFDWKVKVRIARYFQAKKLAQGIKVMKIIYAFLPQVGTPQNSWWGCARPKRSKNHTSLFGVAHTYMAYIRETPPCGLFPHGIFYVCIFILV